MAVRRKRRRKGKRITAAKKKEAIKAIRKASGTDPLLIAAVDGYLMRLKHSYETKK